MAVTAIPYKALGRMHTTSEDRTSEREELRARRNLLFKRFVEHPSEIRMSVEIKRIDDQIAEFTERIHETNTIASKRNAA